METYKLDPSGLLKKTEGQWHPTGETPPVGSTILYHQFSDGVMAAFMMPKLDMLVLLDSEAGLGREFCVGETRFLEYEVRKSGCYNYLRVK